MARSLIAPARRARQLAALWLVAAAPGQAGSRPDVTRAIEPGIAWQTDLAGARARARASGKPLLVLFRCET